MVPGSHGSAMGRASGTIRWEGDARFYFHLANNLSLEPFLTAQPHFAGGRL
jgi:hypothetical protein